MIETFLITSRETLEAALVAGIVLVYLKKTDNARFAKMVYWGIGAGILASIVVAMLFSFLTGGFEGKAEQIFEGTTMLIGAAILSTLIYWMIKQQNISHQIKKQVDKHMQAEHATLSYLGIFLLIFVAVFREGVETVIFLNAAAFAAGFSLVAALLGVAVSVLLGYLFFKSALGINIKHVFTVSTVLLVLFAAGLISHSVHEFEEAGVIPELVAPLFDINPAVNADGSFPLLHEDGALGTFAAGLFGYNGDPSLTEVISYFGYILLVLLFIFILSKSPLRMAQAQKVE